jgi:5S rRNA maturation endonuclease (ribonuclease M5)
MTKEEFKTRNTIASILESRGVKVPGNNRKFVVKCPFHQDRNPSFSVENEQGLWNCHAGCGGGDIFDLLAKFDGVSTVEALKRYVPRDEEAPAPKVEAKPVIETIYSYTDENGVELYQCLRMRPKTFRQRHIVAGQWLWNLEGVRRVLYRLPEVTRAEKVWIVEGEKDADNLRALGFCATCNPMGAGKWLDSYSEDLKGKEIVLCGDNDTPGQKHMETIQESVSTRAKTLRKVTLPGDFKDVSDYIAAFNTKDEARLALEGMMNAAMVLVKGVYIPVFAITELEDHYREHIRTLSENQFNIGKWLPTLGQQVRGLVPGELVTILASTGVGKTAILQNICKASSPLPTVLFEMELPPELVYERFLGVAAGWSPAHVEKTFKAALANSNDRLGEMENIKHVYVCTEPKLTPERLEQFILRSELKIGQRPKVVMLDYIQLVEGKGKSRYEKMSNVAEELKIIAKSTRVILFVTSQIHRKEGEDPEVTLFDAKDSGSIENSSGLVLGAWRDLEDKSKLLIKILKNTKGTAGITIPCHFQGESMRIVETAKPKPEMPVFDRD